MLVSIRKKLERFKIFTQENDFQAQEIAKKGPIPLPRIEKQNGKESSSTVDLKTLEVTNEQQQVIQTNDKVINILYYEVSGSKQDKITRFKKAKELCDKLEVLYKVTIKVKQARIGSLVDEHKLFKMATEKDVESMLS